MYILLHLNYLHVLIAAVVGFMFGWLWYSALFGNTWRIEMKITDEQIAAAKPKMGQMMAKGFLYTFLSTVGLAYLLAYHRPMTAFKGAEIGAIVGLLVVGARFLNQALWDNRSCKLVAINVGHEVVLFALQGAVLTLL